MTEWFERASTSSERLALTPRDVFGAGLLPAGDGATPPSGLREELSSVGPLTLIDHLTAADTSAEAFEVSMVGFDVVRDRLGSAGEVGPETCASLRYQLRPDAEDYPVLGRWLAGLIDTIRCRRDLDAAITFLEETRRVWAALPSAPVKHGGDAASRDARAAGSPPAEVVTQRVGADELGPWQQRP